MNIRNIFFIKPTNNLIIKTKSARHASTSLESQYQEAKAGGLYKASLVYIKFEVSQIYKETRDPI